MAIDSKVVNKAINRLVWPQLKVLGFTRHRARTAWCFGSSIYVVNFQSFNSYLAGGIDCTTYSFAVNLGLHFEFMPWGGGTEYLGPEKPPHEAQCIFRRSLRRSVVQPGNLRPDIWAVDPDGFNVDLCVADAMAVIEHEGLPWFAALSDTADALRRVQAGEESYDKFGPVGTWGFGRPGSPLQRHAITYLRTALTGGQS